MDIKTSIFEGFYSHFILHDLFGKIIPGSIVLLSIVVAKAPTFDSLSKVFSQQQSFGWMFWIGAAWLLGFSLQFSRKDWSSQLEDQRERYKTRIRFFSNASDYERNQAQRFSLVGDATGNGARASGIAALILFLVNINDPVLFLKNYWMVEIGLCLVTVSLYSTHKSFNKKHSEFLLTALELRSEDIPAAEKDESVK
jgi:hypothetical protein